MVQFGFAPLTREPTVGVKFVSAGFAACIADMITFPLDTAKVRLQIQGESGGPASAAPKSFRYRGIVGTLVTISKQEGPRAMYSGLAAGLQRQMCFASVRIGLYDEVKKKYQTLLGSTGGKDVGIRIIAGITTGAMAVSCAQPTDVVKVRMQAQGSTGVVRYTGCMKAYSTIFRTEGVRGLWKGTLPNICRNSVVNATELVSYDLIKEQIIHLRLMSDNMPCHFVSAFGAGFCTTVMSSPIDVVKTRYMNSEPGKYTGALHCAKAMFKERGLLAFYKGFMPSFVRLGSWNICMFVSFEQIKRGFTHYGHLVTLTPYTAVVTAAPHATTRENGNTKKDANEPKKVFDHISDRYFIDPY